jgi:hypothetical protein
MEQPPQKSNSWGDWLLPYNSQAREAGEGVNNIGKALNKFSTDGVTLKTDKETIDSFREGTDAINNTSASIEKMGKTFDELNKEGLKLSNTTIKTFFTASVGFALAIAGIILIYYDLTKPVDETTEVTKPKTVLQKIKRFFKSRSTIGTASIIAGLVLIARSNKVAAHL